MLEQQELDRINKTFSDLQRAENEVVAIEAEVGVIKKQAKEIFTKYGLTGFGDIDKLKEMLKEREEQILDMEKPATEYITAVNKVKEEKENILLG